MHRNSEFNFGPTFYPGLIGPGGRLTVLCKGNSSTQSNPNNSQTVTDNRLAASDGSIAAATGSTVTVQNLSADVIAANDAALGKVAEAASETSSRAVDAVAKASSDASYNSAQAAAAAVNANAGVSKAALQENSDVSKAAIAGAGSDLSNSLDFGRAIYHESIGANQTANNNVEDIAKAALGFASTNQQSVNDLIQHTNDSFTQKLVANQGLAASSLQDNFGKYAVIGAVVVVVGILVLSGKK